MKKNEVKVGGLYTTRVSERLVTVRIDSTDSRGGWNATTTATGKRIRIKSAQRLGAAARKTTKAETSTATKAAVTKDEKAGDDRPAPRTTRHAGPKPKRVSALDADLMGAGEESRRSKSAMYSYR